MAFYNKTDMVYNDYIWATSTGDNPKIIGKPDSTFLSRKEGYEVLDFINSMAVNHNLQNKASGEKIEKMLRKVPGHLRSHKHIEEWIVTNWKAN